jgi:hypothetical protein
MARRSTYLLTVLDLSGVAIRAELKPSDGQPAPSSP